MLMHTLTRRGRAGTIAAVLAGIAVTAFIPPAHSTEASSSVQALIATAEHDTNTVKTLVHHDVVTRMGATWSVQVTAHGTEDEARNREQDYESVIVKQTKAGKTTTMSYTVDLIFLNGSTYYRTSSAPTQWKTQKGMTFPDPYTGGWKRGRTTVALPAGLVFTVVGTSGGETHVHATNATKTVAGSFDLWITAGATPYVAREDMMYRSLKKGSPGTFHVRISYGPFNSAVNITPPAQASA